jgi:hypothetical protein
MRQNKNRHDNGKRIHTQAADFIDISSETRRHTYIVIKVHSEQNLETLVKNQYKQLTITNQGHTKAGIRAASMQVHAQLQLNI